MLLYGYCRGVVSSRKIERATYEDVAFRYLAADQHPDHDTISDFRQTHLPSLAGLFSPGVQGKESRCLLESVVDTTHTGNREQHMLDHCKSIAKRAKLESTKSDLKRFRSTYATGMLRRDSMYGPRSTGWATSPWRPRCDT
jgi:hypothetical protein